MTPTKKNDDTDEINNNSVKVEVAKLKEWRIGVDARLDDCVTKDEFGPVRSVLYGAVGLILTAVVAALVVSVLGDRP